MQLLPYLKKYYRIIYYADRSAPGKIKLSGLYSELLKDKNNEKLFKLNRLPGFKTIFFQQLSTYMDQKYFNKKISHYKNGQRLFKKYDFKYFIKNENTQPVTNLLNKIAEKHRVKRITFQHGSYGTYSHTILTKCDFLPNEKYFIFGRGVYNYYKKYSPGICPKLSIVGNIEKKQVNDRKQGKTKILYATTNYENNSYYFKGPGWKLSDRKLMQVQSLILRELKALQDNFDFELIFKLHPGANVRDEHLADQIKELKFKSVSIIKSGTTFQKLINTADLILIDVPSTTLLYASETTKPIFITTELLALENEALQKMKKSNIYFDSSTKKVLKKLRDFLNKQNIFEPATKPGFSTHYFRPWSISKGIKKALCEFGIK
jgi:hypothetical protein